MQFSTARPDVVRAINQRWLLTFWNRHRGAHAVPQWQEIEAENLSRMADSLSFLDVIRDEGELRFQIRFHGATIGLIYGATNCIGKFLHASQPETARREALAPYRHVVENRRPVYVVHDVTDRAGRVVHSERLLLPFSPDGQTVDRILASFEFVSPDGAFESRGLMQSLQAPPALKLLAAIDPHATA